MPDLSISIHAWIGSTKNAHGGDNIIQHLYQRFLLTHQQSYMPGFHHGIRISHSRFLSGDSVFQVSNGVAKMHDLFGGRPPVEHAEHSLGSRLVLLGRHHTLLDMLRRRTSQDIALEIRRGENVSRGSRLHLTGGLLRRGALLLVGKGGGGLVLGEHELVGTVEVLQEGIASGVHVWVEGDLLLRRVLEGRVLGKLL